MINVPEFVPESVPEEKKSFRNREADLSQAARRSESK